MNAPVMNRPAIPTADDIRPVEAFLVWEARLLDERRFEEWQELFVEEGYYWAPARHGQTDPWSESSLMFDDREIMANRIQRLRHPKVYAQIPASQATRQVTNVSIDEVDAQTGELTVRSVFFMFEHRATLPQPLDRIFAGEYRHHLRREADSFRIVWKKAVLVNCDSTFDPLFLYF
ncbi:MAG: phenoxybenzoate dioxygenase [Betaproteobacteria bacterium]|nr:phenoxybenzoate dioxygenase [Betaproteobacteria bacterium]